MSSIQNTTLDEDLGIQAPGAYNHATTGQRFVNFLIDIFCFYLLFFLIGIVMGVMGAGDEAFDSIWLTLLVYLTYFLYFFVTELTLGKTLGKFVSRTKVVMEDGSALTSQAILIRSISRFVPFEFLTAFSSNVHMWHDKWAKTRVVRDA